jgi:gas vesicle protein
MVNAKHIATFLLGAAAGAAIMKYNSMTPEEQEELMADLKEKANTIKDEAEKATETAKTYMSELQEKGMDSLKDYMGETEKMFKDMFNPQKAEEKTI